jgi:hypothetical protein
MVTSLWTWLPLLFLVEVLGRALWRLWLSVQGCRPTSLPESFLLSTPAANINIVILATLDKAVTLARMQEAVAKLSALPCCRTRVGRWVVSLQQETTLAPLRLLNVPDLRSAQARLLEEEVMRAGFGGRYSLVTHARHVR